MKKSQKKIKGMILIVGMTILLTLPISKTKVPGINVGIFVEEDTTYEGEK